MPSEFRSVSKFCKHCNKPLILRNNRDIQRKNYCGHSCRAKDLLTQERIAKFVSAGHTPEANARKGMKGADHPKWIEDRSKVKVKRSISEMRWWRKSIFQRDNYTCVECGVRGKDLQAHHKAPVVAFPQFKFDLENGITLCKPCHTEIHKVANDLFDCGGFMNKIKEPRYVCK